MFFISYSCPFNNIDPRKYKIRVFFYFSTWCYSVHFDFPLVGGVPAAFGGGCFCPRRLWRRGFFPGDAPRRLRGVRLRGPAVPGGPAPGGPAPGSGGPGRSGSRPPPPGGGGGWRGPRFFFPRGLQSGGVRV